MQNAELAQSTSSGKQDVGNGILRESITPQANQLSLHPAHMRFDISAGTCILNEAGGFMYSAQPPIDYQEGDQLPTADLGGRLYLAIRPCSGTENETAREAQDRVAKEIWKRVERMDYVRPT